MDADAYFGGRPFTDPSPAERLAWNTSLDDRVESEWQRYKHTVLVKALLKDRLELAALPLRLGQALQRKQPPDNNAGQVISQAWFCSVLGWCNKTWPKQKKRAMMVQALFWLLWDAGLRIKRGTDTSAA